MKILGYNGGLSGYLSRFGGSHDAAAAVVVDGEVVAAAEQERFDRLKHSNVIPVEAIRYCLAEAGIQRLTDLDRIAYYWSFPRMYVPEMVAQNRDWLSRGEAAAFHGLRLGLRAANFLGRHDDRHSRRRLEKAMAVQIEPDRYVCVPHHLCHAAGAFYSAPFDEALVVTLDAAGESASSIVARARKDGLEVLEETLVPNSLGFLYMWITEFLGFWPNSDEYKVMGLAAYGDPAPYRSYFEDVVRNDASGHWRLDPGLFLRLTTVTAPARALLGRRSFPRGLRRALGPPRMPEAPIEQRHMDVAAALQEAVERVVLRHLERLRKDTGERNLCMSGGVALNSRLAGEVARSGLFDEVWIPPAAHDAGTSLGAALHTCHVLNDLPKEKRKPTSVFLGPGTLKHEVTAALSQFADRVVAERPSDLEERTAAAIADGKVVAWHQGRMEWGQRALGNRSILADPRRDDMKDIVNHAVKKREGFRPFAPSVLAERAREWFDLTGIRECPYMVFVVPVWPDRRARIPAVTHVDGSARIHTVSIEDNPRYHALLRAFENLTGVPVVLNTSFNVRGEPIVNTPGDALRCFLSTQIDVLVLDDVLIVKRPEEVARMARETSGDPWKTGRVVGGRIEAP